MTARWSLLLAGLLAAAVGASGQNAPFTITPTSLPVGGGIFVVGQTIPLQQLAPNPNLDASFTWSYSGSLPPGLSLDSNFATITGTPTVAGAFTFTVKAVEFGNIQYQAFQQYTLYVASCLPLALTAATHTPAAAGTPYVGSTFQASCGVPGYSWSLASGTDSDGLTLIPGSSLLSGIPFVGGNFPIGVVVTDASGAHVSASFTLSVLGVGTQSLPDGSIGVSYSQNLASSGATGPVTWALSGSGPLPPGLSLSPQGQITGTPTTSGTYPFHVAVTDTVSHLSSSQALSINIPAGVTITTASLPNGIVGTVYPTQTLAATGASGTLTWTLSSGTLPGGLGLSAQGQITGTPTTAGTFTFVVGVADSVSLLTATKSLSITITAPLTVTTTSPLPNGTAGIAYSQTLQGAGGTAPYHWTATGLPAGITLAASTGILSGTPTSTGTSTIAVTLTDSAQVPATATASLSLTVGALAISPATLPTGFVGVPYPATTLTVAGATIANWAVTAGALPGGLALNASTGVITGTPTTPGSSTFTVTATFGAAAAAVTPLAQAFTIAINPLPSVQITGLPTTGVAGTQPAATVSLGGGTTYPLNITGTMTLTFAPAGGGTQPFDAKFASGPPTTATFTIPAGTSQGLFGSAPSVPVMIGTVAGTITITTTLQDPTVTPPAPVVIPVNSTVPVIKAVSISAVTGTGFTISVTGYSTPRDMTNAVFTFAAPTNTTLTSSAVTVPLTTAFATWYGSTASTAFGSQFTMSVQFTYTAAPGTTVPFTAVSVTLTNSKGTSNSFGPVNP